MNTNKVIHIIGSIFQTTCMEAGKHWDGQGYKSCGLFLVDASTVDEPAADSGIFVRIYIVCIYIYIGLRITKRVDNRACNIGFRVEVYSLYVYL